tara:strand:- start:941 stop:1099 length:159 start_codon:yes stop_codon:yes gene_type:complete
MGEFESQYQRYDIVLDGKKTYVYASKHMTKQEATKDIKNRFRPMIVTKVKPT